MLHTIDPLHLASLPGDSDSSDKSSAVGLVKQMETKTYSCSECGLKTPSRMTYIQVGQRVTLALRAGRK